MIYLNITVKPDQGDIERRKRKRNRAKVYRAASIAFLLLTGFCWGITPFCFQYAELQRGYKAIGGEIFVPLLPIVFYYGLNWLCEMIIEMKGWNEK